MPYRLYVAVCFRRFTVHHGLDIFHGCPRWFMATSSWPRSRQNFYGTDRMDFSKYAADTVVQMKAQGCSYLRTLPEDPVTGNTWCPGAKDLWGPLAYLCPESCGCANGTAEDQSDVCPSSCTGGSAYGYGY
ncbi:unnamed protein product [Durusdinium trenchii]|uniref:Uncharacterized protein n=1 Tax=Durusdinium trenchii TaxID=1381693 RepID=A0ABP0NNT5_9DINO